MVTALVLAVVLAGYAVTAPDRRPPTGGACVCV